MKKIFSLFFSFILFSLQMASCQTKEYKEKLESLYNNTVPLIGTEELFAKMQSDTGLVLLDIRSEEEYAVSRIAEARFIDYDNFSFENVQDIPKSSEVVVYCSVGYRSEKIGEKLLAMGFSNVKNLYGGIFQWKNDGFEVINQQSEPTDSVHTYNKSWSKWLVNGVKVY
jgi:rhodanese-related sulfurtransferase